MSQQSKLDCKLFLSLCVSLDVLYIRSIDPVASKLEGRERGLGLGLMYFRALDVGTGPTRYIELQLNIC